MTLREYIIDYRTRHELSQRQFAHFIGLSNGYISMIENGTNPHTGKPVIPSLVSYKKIADGTGLSLQKLLDMLDDQPVSLMEELSPVENDLLRYFRAMPEDDRAAIMQISESLAK